MAASTAGRTGRARHRQGFGPRWPGEGSRSRRGGTEEPAERGGGQRAEPQRHPARRILADRAPRHRSAAPSTSGKHSPAAEAVAVRGGRILADFVVLSANRLEADPGTLAGLKVAWTFKGGTAVHGA